MTIWDDLYEKLIKGQPVMLAVIVCAKGSTPRHQGSYMLVDENGLLAGTVGGGSVEYETINFAKDCLIHKVSRNFTAFMGEGGATGDPVCGGEAVIRCEYLSADENGKLPNWFATFYDYWKEEIPCYLEFPIDQGGIVCGTLKELEAERLHDEQKNGTAFIDYFQTEGTVYLFGAGHVAKALAPLLSMLQFKVLTLDDRKDLLAEKSFVESGHTGVIDYEEFSLDIKENDYVVVATRGHAYDTEVLRKVLPKKPHYIGVMGSKRKALIVREKLLSEGFSSQDVDRICTPIGVDISSETPEEVAVSIAAQLIKVRRSKKNR